MVETFEFNFVIGDTDGKISVKIYPERDKNGLFSSGRYICEEKVDSYCDDGEWASEGNDTTHFSDKNMALRYIIKIIQGKIKDKILEELTAQRNGLNRQIATLKKESLN